MRVIVSCGELRMDIPVGQGEQSMTWLALVASQRYALRKPSGQRRAREESHAVRGFFLPEEMSTEDGGVTDPNAKICDVLEDGGTVSVKLMKTVQTDAVGAPVFSQWTEAAFASSEAASIRVQIAKERQALDVAAQKSREAQERALAADESVSMNVLVAGPLETDLDVSTALNYDWSAMDINSVEPKEAGQLKLKELLEVSYRVFNSIFIFYCGSARPGHVFGMDYDEFSHFAHVYGLFHAKNDAATIKKVFLEAAIMRTRGKKPIEPILLSRADFVFGAMKLMTASSGGDYPAAFLCIEAEIEKLSSLWSKFSDNAVIAAMEGRQIEAILTANRPHLRRIVNKFSADANTLTPEQFQELCSNSGICSTTLTEEGGVAKVLQMASNAALVSQREPSRDRELESMVFGEVIYSIAQIATTVMDPSDPTKSIRLGVDQLLEYSLSI